MATLRNLRHIPIIPLVKWRRPLFDIWGVIAFFSCVLSALWTIAIGFGAYMVFR